MYILLYGLPVVRDFNRLLIKTVFCIISVINS